MTESLLVVTFALVFGVEPPALDSSCVAALAALKSQKLEIAQVESESERLTVTLQSKATKVGANALAVLVCSVPDSEPLPH